MVQQQTVQKTIHLFGEMDLNLSLTRKQIVKEAGKQYTRDNFLFQIQEWKNGIFFINYAGGYKKNPKNDIFFGHAVGMMRDGIFALSAKSETKIVDCAAVLKITAEKSGMVFQ